MSSTKQKLRLPCAFAALATLALALSCRGFFVNPTLTSIAISPTAPNVEQGKTLQLQAFGTYNDGSRNQVRSGVSWSSSPSTVASIDPNTGILTGVTPGTSTITASSQALSSTATATVFIVIDSISISPTSASVKSGGTQNFTVSAASNGATLNLTSSATLTAEQNGTAVTTVTCTYNSSIPAQVCTTTAGTTGVFQIVASYSGSTLTATATLTVN
jgi:trimeric autotransporter adhesin